MLLVFETKGVRCENVECHNNGLNGSLMGHANFSLGAEVCVALKVEIAKASPRGRRPLIAGEQKVIVSFHVSLFHSSRTKVQPNMKLACEQEREVGAVKCEKMVPRDLRRQKRAVFPWAARGAKGKNNPTPGVPLSSPTRVLIWRNRA